MNTKSTDAAWSAARAADVATMNRDELAGHLAAVQRLRAWADAEEVKIVHRTRQLEANGSSESPDVLLANTGGRSRRDARAADERASICKSMPAFEAALADGAVSAGHVDALANAARRLDEAVAADFVGLQDDLLADAERMDVDTFERETKRLAKHLIATARSAADVDELEAQRRASRVARWIDKTTGMHHTMLELDPVRDAKLHSAVNAELASLRQVDGNHQRPWGELQVDAFVNAVSGDPICPADDPADGAADADQATDSSVDSSDGRSTGRCDCGCACDRCCGVNPSRGSPRVRVDRVPEISLLVSYDQLIDRARAAGICETENGVPLPIATVRRMCCDAEVMPVVIGTAGEVLDHGRSIRTASRAQRRALRAMHSGCAHPECGVGFDACRIHHVRWWWEHLGATDIDNLLPLCERHHHQVHEGAWQLTMTPDRIATWLRPDGSHFYTGNTIDRTAAANGSHPTRSQSTGGGR